LGLNLKGCLIIVLKIKVKKKNGPKKVLIKEVNQEVNKEKKVVMRRVDAIQGINVSFFEYYRLILLIK